MLCVESVSSIIQKFRSQSRFRSKFGLVELGIDELRCRVRGGDSGDGGDGGDAWGCRLGIDESRCRVRAAVRDRVGAVVTCY